MPYVLLEKTPKMPVWNTWVLINGLVIFPLVRKICLRFFGTLIQITRTFSLCSSKPVMFLEVAKYMGSAVTIAGVMMQYSRHIRPLYVKISLVPSAIDPKAVLDSPESGQKFYQYLSFSSCNSHLGQYMARFYSARTTLIHQNHQKLLESWDQTLRHHLLLITFGAQLRFLPIVKFLCLLPARILRMLALKC